MSILGMCPRVWNNFFCLVLPVIAYMLIVLGLEWERVMVLSVQHIFNIGGCDDDIRNYRTHIKCVQRKACATKPNYLICLDKGIVARLAAIIVNVYI